MTNDSGSTATSARSATGGSGSATSDATPRPRAAAEPSGPTSAEPSGPTSAEPSGPTAAEPLPGQRAAAGPGDTVGSAETAGLAGTAGLAALALAWLAAMLWVAHAAISSDVGAVALATATSTLPSVVSAGLMAGAAAGLAAASLIAGAGGRPWLRFAAAAGAGVATGTIAGLAFVIGSGSDPARMAVAGTMAAGATVGGALAGARSARVIQGVVAAMLAMFATGVLLGLVKSPLKDLYGAGAGEASQASAAGWFAATVAVVSGLAAGLTAYRVLGGARRNPALRWPAYLVAGAGPGALLLVTELIIRTGGAKLFGLVRQISEFDRTVQDWADDSRVNNALVVMFVGAIVAIVGLGRTLGSPGEANAGPQSADAGGPQPGDAGGSASADR